MKPVLGLKPHLNHSLSLNPSSTFSSLRGSPQSFSFYDGLLNSCYDLPWLQQIHSSLVTSGIISKNPHLCARVIIKYAQFGKPNSARSLYDADKTSSFLWNTMIRAYANGGHSVETLDLYSVMRRNGTSPDSYTFPFALKACASRLLILEGEVIHGEAIKTGFSLDLYVEAALVDMYAKCGQIDAARQVFDEMPMRDTVCWTAMITACEQAELPEEALVLFQKMQQAGVFADAVSIVSVASAIAQLGDSMRAQMIHAQVICNGYLMDVSLANAVISMYAKCGNLDKARLVFDLMEERDGITWNSMLSGYSQNGQASKALLLFYEMLDLGHRPNPVTVLIMVSVCAYLGYKYLGRKLHDFIIDNRIKLDANLQNALMDMYAKCGELDTALRMFNDIDPSERNVSSWNVLISGCGTHGYGKQALELFSQMVQEGIEPDHMTFTSILSACSHTGLIEEGRKCFVDMKKNFITPHVKHYACMVDMLGRAGRLYEAFQLIRQMPSPPNDDIWGALLLACRIHGNTELGEIAAKNLFQLEPEHAGYHVLMSNLYAASNRWQEVWKLREHMKKRRMRKHAAFSVIEFGREVHGFHTADRVNPFWQEVHWKIESLQVEMKMAGYVPDLSCVLHDVDEEDKEDALKYHSEKLAVAFGIMKIDPGLEIQVTKNLRICNDCHSAFKCISLIYGRKIIVRDGNRFHHFSGGTCSCNDYW